jgi:hypothetical protein
VTSDWIEWAPGIRFRRSAVASAKRSNLSGASGYTTNVKVTLLNGEVYTKYVGSIFHGAGLGQSIDVSEQETELAAQVEALLDEVTA